MNKRRRTSWPSCGCCRHHLRRMEPALLVGDFVYVAKLPRSLFTPQREAIVVFRSVEDSTPHLSIVKRVIGVPGDTLQMVHDAVYRNAALLDEAYARRTTGGRWSFRRGTASPWETTATNHTTVATTVSSPSPTSRGSRDSSTSATTLRPPRFGGSGSVMPFPRTFGF